MCLRDSWLWRKGPWSVMWDQNIAPRRWEYVTSLRMYGKRRSKPRASHTVQHGPLHGCPFGCSGASNWRSCGWATWPWTSKRSWWRCSSKSPRWIKQHTVSRGPSNVVGRKCVAGCARGYWHKGYWQTIQRAMGSRPCFLMGMECWYPRWKWSKRGWTTLTMTGHSGRRSGAMWYARLGLPIHEIGTLGRWKSSAVFRYIEEALQDIPLNAGVARLELQSVPSTPAQNTLPGHTVSGRTSSGFGGTFWKSRK